MLNCVGRWLIRTLIAALGVLLTPLTHLLSLRRRRRCPPPANPLLFHSAAALARMINTRKIRSEDAISAYIERCKEVNPYVNGIVEPRFEVALREARAIDRALDDASEKERAELAARHPLLGVPVTVKESIAVEGMSNDCGCVRARRDPARRDADAVRLARGAGAVPLAVTNTPQLCMHWETYNYVTGLTTNPHCQKRTVGGSSGGEAALLSAGASVVGIGSDIAGSLRLPAMFTGVFGHKPTPRIVSTEGHYPGSTDPEWDDYFALGPMTRYAEDIPLMLKVLGDTRHQKLQLDKKVEISKLKLCYIENDTSGVADKIGWQMRQSLEKVKQYFKKNYGIDVEEIKIKNSEHIWEISSRTLLGLKGVENIYTRPEDPEKLKAMWPEILKKACCLSDNLFTCVVYGPCCKLNNCLPQADKEKIRNLLEELKKDFAEVLKGDTVLFYPTYPEPAHVHYQIFHRFLNLSYLTIFNVLGLPVTQCPLGLGPRGLPVGLQIVADKYNDRLTIAVAKELEKAFGGWVPPNRDMMSNGKSNV